MGQFSNVLFIINPSAGRKKFPQLESDIKSACKKSKVEFEIKYTEAASHATQLAREAVDQKFELVFAVGGDGTVNEVAKGLLHSSTTMGIIPKGSGNGLARHIGISRKPISALQLLSSGKSISMDTFELNRELSINVSGIGFDGHIASLFGKSGKRGLREYVSLAASEFHKFKKFEARLVIDGNQIETNAFIIAFANSSQFGNNAVISPNASVIDSFIDVCIVQKVPLLHAIGFAGKMFTRNADKSSFIQIIKGKSASISFNSPMPYHIDGEGREPAKDFEVKIVPSSLKVLSATDRI